MLAGTALLRGLGLNWPASLVALAAMVPVTLLDPWALLQPGFWLSFAAVGLLMVSEPARAAPAAAAGQGQGALAGEGEDAGALARDANGGMPAAPGAGVRADTAEG